MVCVPFLFVKLRIRLLSDFSPTYHTFGWCYVPITPAIRWLYRHYCNKKSWCKWLVSWQTRVSILFSVTFISSEIIYHFRYITILIPLVSIVGDQFTRTNHGWISLRRQSHEPIESYSHGLTHYYWSTISLISIYFLAIPFIS